MLCPAFGSCFCSLARTEALRTGYGWVTLATLASLVGRGIGVDVVVSALLASWLPGLPAVGRRNWGMWAGGLLRS